MSEKQSHPYHLVDPSAWPLLGAFSAMIMFAGAVLSLHGYPEAYPIAGQLTFLTGLGLVLLTMFLWWYDVVYEARVGKHHNPTVQHGLRIGMALFILSEVMFFFGFFWVFFKSALLPSLIMEDGVTHIFENVALAFGTWPPAGIETLDAWDLPLLNTLILLLSGCTCTWAHYAILEKNRKDELTALSLTIILGFTFTALQAYEYHHAAFGFKDGIYPSAFYMATGFHGFHVIVGTLFLTVCWFRAMKGHFTKEGHIGFEFAAWYWHFVDVVWLFLFACVYIWGS